MVNGRYHCAHCLSAAFQIKAVFVFTTLHFILYAMSGNTASPHRSSSPLWYLISVRVVQILLTYTLNSLPSRAYKLSATLKKETLENRLNLIGYLSHEMRSPLNTTFLGLEYINGEMIAIREKITQSTWNGSLTSQTTNFKDFISVELVDSILSTSNLVLDSCRVATSTLDDLLTADKIGDGKLVLSTLQCNPWSVIKKCVNPYSIHAKDKYINFTVEGIDHSKLSDQEDMNCEYSIEADAFKLSQVIRNLLSNALKFTPPGGKVTVLVEILPTALTKSDVSTSRKTLSGHVLKLSVTDSGPGISAEDQQKLFGKYVQINANKLQSGKGSGLGLWISKSESSRLECVQYFSLFELKIR